MPVHDGHSTVGPCLAIIMWLHWNAPVRWLLSGRIDHLPGRKIDVIQIRLLGATAATCTAMSQSLVSDQPPPHCAPPRALCAPPPAINDAAPPHSTFVGCRSVVARASGQLPLPVPAALNQSLPSTAKIHDQQLPPRPARGPCRRRHQHQRQLHDHGQHVQPLSSRRSTGRSSHAPPATWPHRHPVRRHTSGIDSLKQGTSVCELPGTDGCCRARNSWTATQPQWQLNRRRPFTSRRADITQAAPSFIRWVAHASSSVGSRAMAVSAASLLLATAFTTSAQQHDVVPPGTTATPVEPTVAEPAAPATPAATAEADAVNKAQSGGDTNASCARRSCSIARTSRRAKSTARSAPTCAARSPASRRANGLPVTGTLDDATWDALDQRRAARADQLHADGCRRRRPVRRRSPRT